MKIFLETERFYLREMMAEDARGLYLMDSDPEVHKYLGNNPVKDLETCVAVVRKQYEENGIGRWSVVSKDSHEFVGWCGMKLNKEPRNGYDIYYDIGYRLQRRHWGKGIGKECAMACLEYALKEMKLKEIHAAAHSENLASNKILRGIGLVFQNQFTDEGELWNWYTLKI